MCTGGFRASGKRENSDFFVGKSPVSRVCNHLVCVHKNLWESDSFRGLTTFCKGVYLAFEWWAPNPVAAKFDNLRKSTGGKKRFRVC